jgi:hypothetical protein
MEMMISIFFVIGAVIGDATNDNLIVDVVANITGAGYNDAIRNATPKARDDNHDWDDANVRGDVNRKDDDLNNGVNNYEKENRGYKGNLHDGDDDDDDRDFAAYVEDNDDENPDCYYYGDNDDDNNDNDDDDDENNNEDNDDDDDDNEDDDAADVDDNDNEN